MSGPDAHLPPDARPEHEISPHAAAERLGRGGSRYLVLDCRLPTEHETARVEPSLLIPMHEIEQRLDELEEALEERGLEREDEFAVLCHHGQRSLRVALMLQQLGFPGARSVHGGIERWSSEVDASIPRYVRDGARCTVLR